jgi:hypothetical protein
MNQYNAPVRNAKRRDEKGAHRGECVFLERGGRVVPAASWCDRRMQPGRLSDRSDYFKCLESIYGLNADRLCVGHFGIFRKREEIRRFIDGRSV